MSKAFYEKYWNETGRCEGFSMRVVREAFRERSVLDLGCGDGVHLKSLLGHVPSLRATELDVSEEAVRLANDAGIDARLGDISGELPFRDDSFGAVLLSDVLEHFLEPEQVLHEAARVAREAVYISVPNFVSFPARLQVLRGCVPENNSRSKGHVFWFIGDVLVRMITDAGLSVDREYTHTFWQDQRPFGSLTRLALRYAPSVFSLSFVVRVTKRNS